MKIGPGWWPMVLQYLKNPFWIYKNPQKSILDLYVRGYFSNAVYVWAAQFHIDQVLAV